MDKGKNGKIITLSAAKAMAERLCEVTTAEVQAAYAQDYDEIQDGLRLGLTEDDAVLSVIMNKNLHIE